MLSAVLVRVAPQVGKQQGLDREYQPYSLFYAW